MKKCQCCQKSPVAGEYYMPGKGLVSLTRLCLDCYRENPDSPGQSRRKCDTSKKGARS